MPSIGSIGRVARAGPACCPSGCMRASSAVPAALAPWRGCSTTCWGTRGCGSAAARRSRAIGRPGFPAHHRNSGGPRRRPGTGCIAAIPSVRSVMSQLTIILIRKYSSHVLHGLPVPPARHRARDVYLSVSRNHRPPDSPRCRAGLLDARRRAAAAARGWMLRTVRAGGTRADSGTRHAGAYAHRSRVRLVEQALSPAVEACAHALPGIGVLAS